MSDKVAVIASILKPVNDTRMYEKLGLSIRESNKYHVNIIGFGAKNPPVDPGMSFHTLYFGKRMSTGRVLAPWKFLKMLIQLRPVLIVVCTPELLIPATMYKLFSKARLWYDVQENYQRNVRYQAVYPILLKPILRLLIALTEWGTRPLVDQYLLAELGYVKELNFLNRRYTVLENKARNYSGSTSRVIQEPLNLVFSGTLSKENGVLQALSLARTLRKKEFDCKLTLIGYAPSQEVLKKIHEEISSDPRTAIKLIGGNGLVSHKEITQCLENAQFGLVCHQPNPSNHNCIPTKLYEYLCMQLPILLQSHPLWEAVTKPYAAALAFDFNHFNPKEIWQAMHETSFYTAIPGPEVTWEQEALKLKGLL